MSRIKCIPENLKEEYLFIEKVGGNKYKIKHTICQTENLYYSQYFKEDIPCKHCRKNASVNVLSEMRTHFASKFHDYELVDVKHAIHTKCGEQIELPRHWKQKNNNNLCKKCSKKNNQKRTAEKNKARVLEVTNGEYEIVGDFKEYNTPVQVRHNLESCGHEYPVSMNDFFIKGSRCPVCTGRTVTKEMFLNRMAEKHPDYKLLSDYINLSREVTVLHEVCNKEETKLAASYLMSNTPCTYCNNRIRDLELMSEKIKTLTNGEYDVLEFERSSLPALFLHVKCGTKYTQIPSSFISLNNRCPECSIAGRPRTQKGSIIAGDPTNTKEIRFKNKVEAIFPDYTLIDRGTIRHNKCGKEFSFKWLLDKDKRNETLCTDCRDEIIQERWLQERSEVLRDKTNGEYILVGIADFQNKKAIIKHNVEGCGHEFSRNTTYFIGHNAKCPICFSREIKAVEFWDRFTAKFGDDFELVDYQGLENEVSILHSKCNKISTRRAKNLIYYNKKACNHCKNK